MLNDRSTQDPLTEDNRAPDTTTAPDPKEEKGIARIWEMLVRIGLGETTLRVATSLLSIILFLIVVWVMSRFYIAGQAQSPNPAAAAALVAQPTATPQVALPTLAPRASSPQLFEFDISQPAVQRLALLHTDQSEHSRTGITQYTVVEGDTITSIAERYGIKPETILWGNRETLGDDPHMIFPGQTLNILPVNGIYHKWSAGEGLNGVANFFHVTPEDIVNYPGNHLTAEAVGDFSNPNIEPGTYLIIPNGWALFSDWKTPRISRDNPAVARNLGAGFCGEIANGITGDGKFIWPTTNHFLSGYDYTPSTNHFGIDIDGETGYPIYAVDDGVVVFAGESATGYGIMVVIDHGGGWQSLYAHLSKMYVSCGMNVFQGATIGDMGSTGRSSGSHLHFELRSDKYGRVNPWDFLP